MTAPATCTISGTLYTAAGAALEGRLVRIRVLPYDSLDKFLLEYPPADWIPTTSVDPQEVETSSAGAWSVTVPQGAVIRVEIPAAYIDHAGTVPSESTATLDDLGLYRVKS
jgi:hypothetical protein